MTDTGQPAAGWYPDPDGTGQQRYYDGTAWTANYAPGAGAAEAAPPPAGPAPAMGPGPVPGPEQSAKKKRGCLYGAIAALVLLVVIVIAAVATSGSSNSNAANHEAFQNTKITSCASNNLGNVEIKGTVKNTTSKTSDYTFSIEIKDASGAQLDAAGAAARGVAPGATANWSAPTKAKGASGVECVVSAVDRTAVSS